MGASGASFDDEDDDELLGGFGQQGAAPQPVLGAGAAAGSVPPPPPSPPPADISALPDNTFGKMLYTQLTSADDADKKKAFDYLIDMIELRDVQFRKESFDILTKFLNQTAKDNLTATDDVFADLNNAYAELKKLLPDPKVGTYVERLDLLKSRKKEIDKIRSEIKGIYKSIFTELRKNTVLTSMEPSLINDAGIQDLVIGLCSDGVNSILETPVVQVGMNAPTTMDLRDARDQQIPNAKISQQLLVAPKSGGKNNPGSLGGVYVWPYVTTGAKLPSFQMQFNKQPTDTDNKTLAEGQNIQEAIAEVMGGRIMNDMAGAYSGPITVALAPSHHGAADPDNVFIGSIYHKDFIDLHSAAYAARYSAQNISGPLPSRKAAYPLIDIPRNWNFKSAMKDLFNNGADKDTPDVEKLKKAIAKEKNLAVKKGLQKKLKDEQAKGTAHLSLTFGSAIAVNILAGNYQLHAENLGIATVDGKRSVVSLDYGGAFRRNYTGLNAKTMEQGRFRREVNPEGKIGKKYFQAYLTSYPKEIRDSIDFARGVEAIANRPLSVLVASIDKNVDDAIKLYGAKVYLEEFAKNLDTRKGNIFTAGTQAENEANVGDNVKQFLKDAMIARQLGLKEFATSLSLQALAKNSPERAAIFADNPYVAIKEDAGKIPANASPTPADLIGAAVRKDFSVLELMTLKDRTTTLMDLMVKRLELSKRLCELGDWEGNDQKKKETIDELSTLINYFNASSKNNYNMESNKDRTVLYLACDRAFSTIKHAVDVMPQALQQEYIDLHESATPDIVPKNSADAKIYAQEFSANVAAKMAGHHRRPSAASTTTSQSGSSSPSSRSRASSMSSNSPSRLFNRHRPLIPTPAFSDFEKDILGLIGDTASYYHTDKTARQLISEFFKSDFGKRAEADPSVFDLTKLLSSDKIVLPANVFRTAAEPVSNITALKTMPILAVSDSQILRNQHSVMSVIGNAPDAARFVEQRVNNLYSVQALRLPPGLSRKSILKDVLAEIIAAAPAPVPPAQPLAFDDTTKKAMLNLFKELEVKSYDPALSGDFAALVDALDTGLRALPNIDDAMAEAIKNSYRDKMASRVFQNFNGQNIPSDAYMEYTIKQAIVYVAEAGSNTKIDISKSNDPMLARAYVIAAQVMGLEYTNSNTYEAKPQDIDSAVIAHFRTKYAAEISPVAGIAVEMAKTISAAVIAGPANAFAADVVLEVNGLAAKVQGNSQHFDKMFEAVTYVDNGLLAARPHSP